MTRSADDDKWKALQALWERLPQVECAGVCGPGVCGPISATDFERRKIEEFTGITVPAPSKEWRQAWESNIRGFVDKSTRRRIYLNCPAFNTMTGVCEAYQVRPTICRIWGTGRGQHWACPVGCPVTGPRLQSDEILEILYESAVIVGEMSPDAKAHRMEAVRLPGVLRALRKWSRTGEVLDKNELDACITWAKAEGRVPPPPPEDSCY